MPSDPWSITDNSSDTGTTGSWQLKIIGSYPYLFNSSTGALIPAPSGYNVTQPTVPAEGIHTPDWYLNSGTPVPNMTPTYTPAYDWGMMPGFANSVGGGGGTSYMSYDPFSQQMEAAKLQESIRQANLAYGMDRAKYLQSVLATPANVFSSFFTARGQVPPYNAQLANILNIPGQNQPFFGSLPPLGETPGIPGIPQPTAPTAIPLAAQGGTFMPNEPAVAIGLKSGMPLFTFNENAPRQTEKVKITPQVPSFANGGTVIPGGVPDMTPLPPLPAPVQDLYNRNFPQFPYLNNLSTGQGLQMPQLGNAMNGFPVPSMQSLNRMLPSEQTSLFDFFNTVLGIPAGDVAWAAQYPFMNLRQATPALQRIG
jgi:hypothetical protein